MRHGRDGGQLEDSGQSEGHKAQNEAAEELREPRGKRPVTKNDPQGKKKSRSGSDEVDIETFMFISRRCCIVLRI